MTKKCKLIAAVLVCLLGVGGTFTLESAQVNAASLTDGQEQYFSQMESNHKSMMKQAVESGRCQASACADDLSDCAHLCALQCFGDFLRGDGIRHHGQCLDRLGLL